ncbi:hypothetical protein Scep_017570 [Stephania cephalantha]|uniref:Uncharacterized protein n=1 Tax=Stephania cephalantha TaxID=152367 RepID=A0AAP0IRM6_9MAGN
MTRVGRQASRQTAADGTAVSGVGEPAVARTAHCSGVTRTWSSSRQRQLQRWRSEQREAATPAGEAATPADEAATTRGGDVRRRLTAATRDSDARRDNSGGAGGVAGSGAVARCRNNRSSGT